MSVLGLLGAGASALAGSGAVGPLISGLFGLQATDRTNQANKDAVESQNKSNELIAQQNLAFQRENLDYQKALQQKIFDREDSSYQRTVSDMRQAGLSPLAMNGTNGAGEAIATAPLENNYQANAYTNRQAQDFSFIGQAMQGAFDNYAKLTSLKQQQDMNQARISNIDAQTAFTLAQTDFFNASAGMRLAGLGLDNRVKRSGLESSRLSDIFQEYLNADKKRQNDYDSYFGLNSSMPQTERALSIALRMNGIDPKNAKLDDIKTIFNNFFGDHGLVSNVIPTGEAFSDFIDDMNKGRSQFNQESDSKIKSKGDNGEKMNPIESLIYFLMKHGIK